MLYNLSCVVSGANTGLPRCAHEPDLLVRSALIPKGKVYTEAQIADIYAVMIADAKATNPLNRIYPVGIYESAESTSTEVQRQTMGYGGTRTVRRGFMGQRFTIINGGKCFHTSMMAFDKQHGSYDIIHIDQKGVLIGTERKDANGNPGLGGFSLMDLYVSDYSAPDGTNGAQFTIEYQYASSEEWNRRYVGVKPAEGDLLTDLSGLKTVNLQNIIQSPIVAGTFRIKATSDCGAILFSQLYAAELDTPTLWDAVNASTGAAITITSVTANPDGTLTFVLDDEDTDFVSGVAIKLSGPTISELEGVSIFGYETAPVLLPNA